MMQRTQYFGKIILFNFLFYGALIGFSASTALDGSNPGLDFWPKPPENSTESILIWYNTSDARSTRYWVDQVDQFLKPYLNPRNSEGSLIVCNPGEPPRKGSNQVCNVRVDIWSPCTAATGYNFNSTDGGPCIFLNLNKILEWEPDYYSSSTMPDFMTSYVKHTIQRVEREHGPNANQLKVVWVSCEGKNPAEKENIGPINFYPKLGFDGQYFPIRNVDEYLTPLVAVHFLKPAREVLINIECKAWARNIIHHQQEGFGSVHFQLLIDQ